MYVNYVYYKSIYTLIILLYLTCEQFKYKIQEEECMVSVTQLTVAQFSGIVSERDKYRDLPSYAVNSYWKLC